MTGGRKSIASRQNDLVQRFRDAAHGDAPGLMLLDGPHLIHEALQAGVVLRSVLVGAEALAKPEIAQLTEQVENRGVEVVQGTSPVLAAASPVRSPSGVVALADRPSPSTNGFSRAKAPNAPSSIVIIACDVQDPGNLGAIMRVAEAAGASGMIAAGTSADPFGWKSLRGSMGSAFRLPVSVVANIDDAVDEARRHGCRIVATAPRGGTELFAADLTVTLACLIGGEGRGLPQSLVDQCDDQITIPMASPVESLNAAVTTALILFEAVRQRRSGDGFAVSGRD